MNRLIKSLVFDGKARVTAIDTTAMVNKAIKTHQLTSLSAAALGRAITAGSYIACNLKSPIAKFSMTIDGKGSLGKIIIAGSGNNKIKGFISNPHFDLPLRADGKIDVSGGVGKDGEITIVKDLGLKEPYIGKSKLVSGEIAEDFASYLLLSEGIPSIVSLGVLIKNGKCIGAGGIFIEAMPDINDDQLFILEDISRNFVNISTLISKQSIEDIVSFHFGHLKSEILATEKIMLDCSCPRTKLKAIILSLGQDEALDIIKEEGKIDIYYDFNGKHYIFEEEEVKAIFKPHVTISKNN